MKFVMAGGGTGGHLFPALALAGEFRTLDPATEIVFIGGVGGLEERVVPKYGYPLRLLNVEGIKRTKGAKRVSALSKALRSTVRALRMLREIRPDGVVGSGSYSSAPVVAAARLLGIKTAILEQNALPGLTNKFAGRFVNRVYIAFEEAGRFFPQAKTFLTGTPIRRDLLDRLESRPPRKNDRFTILIFGGSQGATAINAAFLDAVEYLTDIWGGLRVIHQTGKSGYEQAASAYKRKRLRAEVSEFIEDMGSAYSQADLVVCRAGATSIAELTAFSLASILVPYPFAADNHQEVNARCLEQAGAAVMIKQDVLTGRTLADTIREFYERPGELKLFSEKAGKLGRPDAAEAIAKDFLKLIGTRG